MSLNLPGISFSNTALSGVTQTANKDLTFQPLIHGSGLPSSNVADPELRNLGAELLSLPPQSVGGNFLSSQVENNQQRQVPWLLIGGGLILAFLFLGR